MTISEIGLLKLKPEHSVTDAELRQHLQEITASLEKFTGHPFHFLQQVEDSAFIYLVGEWNSLAEHYESLHNSAEFKERLPVMMKYFDYQWMAHYDFELRAATRLDAGFLEVGRFVVDGGDDKEAFDECVQAVWESISDKEMKSSPLGGWKVDEKREREEYVFLLPFADKEKQQEFYETDTGMAYGALKELTRDTVIRHVRLLK